MSNKTSIIERFLRTRRKILNANPNLVVIAAQPETVLNTVPHVAFRSYLIACLDQVITRTRAGALLITPPPLPARPRLSSKYAAIAKKVGLKANIGVVDVYSRLRLTADWKKLFRPADSQHPSYHIHLNEQGQTIVAKELFNSIVHKYGKVFSQGNAGMQP